MAKAKKTKDYFKLPFEVFYTSITRMEFALVYDPSDPPEWMTDYPAIRVSHGRSYGATFECESNSTGELKAIVYGGVLEEYVPDWMSLVDDEDMVMKSAQDLAYTVTDGRVNFGDQVDNDDLEEEYDVDMPCYYGGDGSAPSYLVLDSKGERLKVDMKGFPLDEAGNRTGQPTVFNLSDDDAYDYDAGSLEWFDITVQLAAVFE